MSTKRNFPECPGIIVSLHTCVSEDPDIIIKVCESEEMTVAAFEAFIAHAQKVLETAKKMEVEPL